MADQSQLDIELQINKAIQARQALLNTQKSMIADQIAFAQELCRALECKELDGYNERLAETKQGLLDASDATEKTSESSQNLTKNLKKSGKGMTLFKGMALGAAVAIKNGFGMAFSVIKGIGKFVKNSLVGAFKIVRFAISGWSKMLGNIAAKGMEAANAGIGLKNAYEDVREQFGGLSTKEGAAVTGAFDRLRADGNNLAGSGLSLSKVFGRGPDGLAAALGYVNEQIAGLGPQLDRFGADLAANEDQVILLGKGLGFTGEDFGNMATMAGHAGESVGETMDRMGREILTVAKNLGVNKKVLADNMKQLMKMPEVYAGNSKEMLKVSVAAQKMGMSIDQLHGPMQIFDDFESGAQAAADLAAEFGIVVDAADMMTAEPAEQMMMLKDAAMAAGKSFDSMSRQERRRLAELSGLDADALFKAMDPSNAFDKDALDAAGNQVDAATAATMAQRDATNELSDAMRRLHESMEPMNTEGGFFGAFTGGLMKGMLRSEQGREIIQSVTKAFKIVHDAGKEVGRVLMQLFDPGGPLHFLYEYFTTLPERMEQLMPKVISAFEVFVADLNAGGDRAAGALRKLVETLAGDIFGSGGGVMQALLDGFHYLGDLILSNIINLVPYILQGFITAFQYAIDLMMGNAPALGVNLGEGAILPMTQNAFQELLSSGVIGEFGSKFMEMLQVFWDQYGDQITEFISMALSAIFIAALGQMIVPILASGAILSLIKGVFGGIGSALGGAAGSGAAGAAAVPQPDMGTKIADLAAGLSLAIEELKDVGVTNAVKAGMVLLAIAGSFMLGVIGLGATAILLEKMGVNDITMAVAAVAFYAMSQMMEPMVNVIEKISTNPMINKKAIMKAAGMILLVGTLFAAVMYFTSIAIKELASITVNDGLIPLVEAAGDLAMTGIVVTGAIVAMGAVLAVLAALGPIGAGLVAGGVAAAGIIFWAALTMVKSVVADLASYTVAQATAAKYGAEAIGIVTESTIKVLGTIWDIMKNTLGGWDSDLFYQILGDLGDVFRALTTQLAPLIQKASDMITEDPQVVKDKMEIIVKLIDSFAPISNLMSAAMTIQDMDPDKIPSLVKNIGDAMTGIISSIEGLVRGIVFSMTGLSEAQIKSAEAAAPLLSAAATMIGALMPAQELFNDQMMTVLDYHHDTKWINETFINQKQKISKTSGEKQQEFIAFMVGMLNQLGGPIQSLVTAVSTITIEGDPKTVKEKMEAIAAVMGAVAGAGEAMSKIRQSISDDKKKMFTIDDANILKQNFSNITFAMTSNGGILQSMGPLINGLVSFHDEMGGEAKLKVLETTVEMINQLNQAVRGMLGLSESDYESFAPKMKAVAAAGEALKGVFTKDTLKPLRAMFDSVAGLQGYFAGRGMSVGLSFDNIATGMSSFATKMSTAMTDILDMSGKFRSDAVEPLLDMVEAYKELNEEAGKTLGEININRLLQSFGEALAIKDANITVEREQIKVNIKLNVIMRTKDVAEQLLEGEYVQGTEKGLKLLDD